MRDFGRAAVSLELPAPPAAPCLWQCEGGHFGTDRQDAGHPTCTYGPMVLSRFSECLSFRRPFF